MTNRKERQDLVRWAKLALHGLDDCSLFVGILDDQPMDAQSVKFTLQLGRCVLTDKPIIVPAPFGVELPKKLAAVADRIVRYDPARLESLKENLAVVFAEMGVNRQ